MFEIPNEFIRAVTKSAEETEEKVRDNESSKYRMSTVPCERLFYSRRNYLIWQCFVRLHIGKGIFEKDNSVH